MFWAQLIVAIIGYVIFGVAFLVASLATGNTPGDVLSSFFGFFSMIMVAAEGGVEPDQQTLMAFAQPLRIFVLAGLIALVPSVYVNIRLAPFAAGSAAENRLLLMGSFALTRGQFWSIFGIYVLLIGALFALALVYSIASQILEILMSIGGGGGALALIAAIFGVLQIGATVLYQAFVLGLQLSTQGIIYRRLKTGA